MGDTNARMPEIMRMEMPRRTWAREGHRLPNFRTRRSGQGSWNGCRRKETERRRGLLTMPTESQVVTTLAAFENVPVTVCRSLLFPFEFGHAAV